MKKQVVFIHGGQVYDNYNAYIKDLESFTIDPYAEKKRWRMNLKRELENYEVFLPEMPNKFNASYREWKIWFEKYRPFLREKVILIGHSLGASFLVRYLSEEELTVSVRALYLIAAPYFSHSQKKGGDFRFDESLLQSVFEKVQEIVFVHSKDDPVVPFDNMQKFNTFFPSARVMEFTDRGHFLQESFPELIEEIKRLR